MAVLTKERRGRVLLLGLNRADKRNAFNLELLSALSAAYGEYERDPELWCALLFAHGEHFTAGLDLGEVGGAVASGRSLFPADGLDPLDLFGERRTKPVVMAVQGWCLTIGIELLLAADVRVAAEGTRFRQMEVSRGIMPFGGATLRFPQVAGWGNAMRYLLTGAEFDAAEALRIGVVQEVVPDGQQVEAALRIAEQIANSAPLAVRATRAAAQTGVERGAEAALKDLMAEARGLMSTEDAAEGVRSFMERRTADFKGR